MLIFFNPELVSPISNIIWYRYRPILTERKLQSCIIKGYLPNKGYATLVRKFESVQDWVIICKNTAETLIALWHRRYAKIILDKNSFSVPMLWLPWHFELDVWCWMRASFRVRNRRYLRGHLNGFSWLAKNLADCGSAQNTQLLEGFFARTELLALADVNFSSPSAKKEIEVMSELLLLTILTIYSR